LYAGKEPHGWRWLENYPALCLQQILVAVRGGIPPADTRALPQCDTRSTYRSLLKVRRWGEDISHSLRPELRARLRRAGRSALKSKWPRRLQRVGQMSGWAFVVIHQTVDSRRRRPSLAGIWLYGRGSLSCRRTFPLEATSSRFGHSLLQGVQSVSSMTRPSSLRPLRKRPTRRGAGRRLRARRGSRRRSSIWPRRMVHFCSRTSRSAYVEIRPHLARALLPQKMRRLPVCTVFQSFGGDRHPHPGH
jgi:hypothetical protein